MNIEHDMEADMQAQWALVKAQVFAKGAGIDLLPASMQKLIETAFRLGHNYGAAWANRFIREAHK